MHKKIVIIIFLLTAKFNFAQNSAIDSIQKILKTENNDSLKVKHLLAITDQFLQIDLKKAEKTMHEAISLSRKIKSKYLITETMGYMGYIKDAFSELDSAIYYYNNAIALCKQIHDNETYPVLINNLASIQQRKGKYNEAIDLQMEAVKAFETNKDKKGMSYSYNNIGEIFWQMRQKQMAIKYFLMAQKLADEINYTLLSAYSANNLGSAYTDSELYDQALAQLMKAVKLYEELGDLSSKARSLQNIGSTYKEMKDFKNAILYTQQAYDIYCKLNHVEGQIRAGYAIGEVYLDNNNNEEAMVWLKKTQDLILKSKTTSNLAGVYRSLSQIYARKKQFENAYKYYVEFKNIKDSLYNVETTSKFQELEAQYQNKKKSLEIDNLKTKEALNNSELEKQLAEIKKQNQQKMFFAGGFLLMILVVVVVFKSYNQKKKDNLIIITQKEEVERQKHIIEEKQKETLDSIAYAKRLQEAILPPQQLVDKYLPQNFILYKPKDIVAGDFYWFEHIDGSSYLAAADSTGHGVPGAMVSVVCSNALNRAVNEFGLRVPGEILNKTRELVLETFAKSDKEVKDGMDISLIKISALSLNDEGKMQKGKLIIQKGQTLKEAVDATKKYKIEWAGANNPLWYYQNDALQEIKAHKQPIGKTDNPIPFPTHTIELCKGDELYLFTDGYADQFGGPKGKKFKYQQLKDVFVASLNEDMSNKKQHLNDIFEAWKGNLEQVDDVCVIGVRV